MDMKIISPLILIKQFDAKNKIVELKNDAAWNQTERIGTIAAYRQYLAKFPNSEYAGIAYREIQELEVIIPAWNTAKRKNTPLAYQYFLNKYPSSSFSQDAQLKLEELEEGKWAYATRKSSKRSYQAYLNAYPNGAYAAEAEERIIDLEVDAIFKGKHGKLPPMDRSSFGSYSSTNSITVKNDTQYTLTVELNTNYTNVIPVT